MNQRLLLTVENAFHLETIQTHFLRPNFSVPVNFPKERSERVLVETPNGATYEANAKFSISHVNIPDPKSTIDDRWRVTVSLLNVASGDIPEGSKIFASTDLAAILLKDNEQ